MSTNEWYTLSAETEQFLSIQWASGRQLSLPYTDVDCLFCTPKGDITIVCGIYRVEAMVVRLASHRDRDTRKILAAMLAQPDVVEESPRSFTASDSAGSMALESARVPQQSWIDAAMWSAALLSRSKDEPKDQLSVAAEQVLDSFQEAFVRQRVKWLRRVPAVLNVRVYQASPEGRWVPLISMCDAMNTKKGGRRVSKR